MVAKNKALAVVDVAVVVVAANAGTRRKQLECRR
jgi:hypothetical protein